MNEIRINSLTEFVSQAVQLLPKKRENSLLQEEVVFRGLSSNSYQLIPSLGRRPSDRWMNTLTFVEKDLISEAQTRFPDIFSNDDLPLIKLAKLQHFGIPTRLMDVTSNALVALYFSCQKSKEHPEDDGEVLAFSGTPVPAISATANLIADTYRLTENSQTPLEYYFYRGIKQDYAIIRQYPNWENNHDYIISSFLDSISKPFIVHSFENSARQKNQHGKYILFPNQVDGPDSDGRWTVLNELVSLDKDDDLIKKRIIIPSAIKDELLTQLSILGISNDALFPDSVDMVFAAVKEQQELRYR